MPDVSRCGVPSRRGRPAAVLWAAADLAVDEGGATRAKAAARPGGDAVVRPGNKTDRHTDRAPIREERPADVPQRGRRTGRRGKVPYGPGGSAPVPAIAGQLQVGPVGQLRYRSGGLTAGRAGAAALVYGGWSGAGWCRGLPGFVLAPPASGVRGCSAGSAGRRPWGPLAGCCPLARCPGRGACAGFFWRWRAGGVCAHRGVGGVRCGRCLRCVFGGLSGGRGPVGGGGRWRLLTGVLPGCGPAAGRLPGRPVSACPGPPCTGGGRGPVGPVCQTVRATRRRSAALGAAAAGASGRAISIERCRRLSAADGSRPSSETSVVRSRW